MNWLISSANKLLRLEDDVAMLATVAALAKILDQGEEIDGIDEPVTLLRVLANGPSPARDRIIDAVRSALLTSEAITEAFDRYRRVVGGSSMPPEYRLLLCRLQAVGTASCQVPAKTLRWRIIDREPAGMRQVFSDLKLDLGAGMRQFVEVAIDPEPAAELGPPPAGRLFRVGLEGSLEGSVAGAVPIRIGAAHAGLAAAAALRLDIYGLRHGNPIIATALSQFFERAPSPYDLAGIVREIEARRLHGIRLRAEGSLERTGGLRVGSGLALIRDLANGVTVGADAAVRFSATDTGSFELTVGSADADPSPGSPVRVRIRRAESRTLGSDGSLRIGVDLSSLMQHIGPELERRLVGLERLRELVSALLPPSRLVQDLIQERVATWFDHAQTRGLIDRMLGQSTGVPLVGVVEQRLGALLDRLDGLWVDRVESAATDLARQLVNEAGAGLDPISRAELMALLQPGLEQILDGLHDRLHTQLEHGVAAAGETAVDGLADELAQLGHGAANGAASGAASIAEQVDALAGPLKLALQGYQKVIARIGDALAEAEQARLALQLRSRQRRQRGQTLDLRMDLDPGHPDAPELYQQVLTGSLDRALARAAREDGAVTALAGELTRFADVSKSSGIEVAFLGIRLDAGRLFRGEVAIRTDQGGNIEVLGRGDSEDTVELLGERRAVSAINVFDLAVARQTRRLALGLTVSQRNERLDDDDLSPFFGSLAAAGIDLLPREVGREALATLRRMRDDDADRLVGGELRVTMELDETELLRLMDIEDPTAGLGGNRLDAERIAITAVDAIIDAMQAPGSGEGTTLNNMQRLAKDRHDGGLRDLLRRMALRPKAHPLPGDIGAGSTDGQLFMRMQRIGERGAALVKLVRALRQVYFSPEPLRRGDWDRDDYTRCQEEIDAALHFWLSAELEHNLDLGRPFRLLFGFLRRDRDQDAEADSRTFGLLNQRVRPYTIGLLLALQRLTIGPGDPGAPLLASMTLDIDGVPRVVPLG